MAGMQMEFWGVEVKAGEPLRVPVDDEFLVHLSQAALGESKKDKGSEPVVLYVTFDSKRLVLGTLSRKDIPQISMDVVFEKEFELSHNWKNGSVYFCGYKANQGHSEESDEEFSDEKIEEDEGNSSEEEAPQLVKAKDGKASINVEATKPAAKSNNVKVEASGKQVRLVDQTKQDEDNDSEDGDDDSSAFESDEDESGASDEEMQSAGDSDDEEEEEEEKKPHQKGKKRAPVSASKTPVTTKKVKPSTPQNADAKKDGHMATPHPSKMAAKANAGDARTPKSVGQFSCKSCNKSFGSEAGLQQHTKAKHDGI